MTFFQCVKATFHECWSNIACAPFFLLAIIFYSFYYCWPYQAQLPYKLATAIVDVDNSPLSRRVARALESTPQLNVVLVSANRQAGIAAMQKEAVVALVEIPKNFERDALAGLPTAITLAANGAFIVKSRSAISAVSGPLQEVATLAVAAQLERNGFPASEMARMAHRAPALIVQPMYNNISGYLNFVVPIVFMIIFQTLMLCGSSMLFNDWFGESKWPRQLHLALSSPLYLFAVQLPIFGICFFWSLAVEGAIFYLHGINSFQNICATISMGITLSLAISSLGMLIGLLFGASRFAIQAIVITSLPCVFISGNLFPYQNIPLPMRALAWLAPSTPGSQGMLRASQAGASMAECLPYLAHLLTLAGIYFLLALVVCHFYRRSPKFQAANAAVTSEN